MNICVSCFFFVTKKINKQVLKKKFFRKQFCINICEANYTISFFINNLLVSKKSIFKTVLFIFNIVTFFVEYEF